MPEEAKANTAKTQTDTILAAYNDGLIGPAVALLELRQAGRKTGTWTNITDEDIADAEALPPKSEIEPPPPPSESDADPQETPTGAT
jgi:hypothetical protein